MIPSPPARGVQAESGRVCQVGGGHGWSRVMDWTGHTSPGDKDTERNRDAVEEALTDGWREDGREAARKDHCRGGR